MEDYIVSARKYRPTTFDDVVGQPALTTTLKNAVKSGKLAHAYLFCGPRGVGKTTCARIFAKAINCLHPTADGEACDECESCKAFNEGRSYNVFELDAASNNSVENIKTLMEQTRIPPQIGKYKVFIIDEVHMLSTSAFNAFLKTLEEPPAHVIFILATTEKHKILPTIISRCQIYDFERMTVTDIINHLKKVADQEGITYEPEALNVIAEKADGGMRDALSIFDQAASFCQGQITYQRVLEDLNVLDADNYFKIIDLSLANRTGEIMLLLNALIAKGFDAGNMVNGLASHVRNVLMAKDPETLPLLEVSNSQRQRFQEQAAKCPTKFLYKALRIMNQCDVNYRQSSNKRLLVELTLIQVAQITQADDEDGVAGRSPKRLKSLFKQLTAPQHTTAPRVAVADKPLLRPTKAAKHEEAVTKPSNETGNAPQPPRHNSPTPGGRTRLKMGMAGLSFKDILKAGQEKTTPAGSQEQKSSSENRQFTQDEVGLQWMLMCNRMPQKMTGIAARMKNMTPRITTFPRVEVTVDNQILLDEMAAIKGRIRASLADGLHNGELEIDLQLARMEEIKPIPTKREVFEDMTKKNPAIEKLRGLLDLELA